MSRIQVNYEEARKHSRELYVLVEECEEITGSLRSVMVSIPEAWLGCAEESYLTLMARRIHEVESMAKEAGSLAAHINSIADSFEATEARLANSMHQQGGHGI